MSKNQRGVLDQRQQPLGHVGADRLEAALRVGEPGAQRAAQDHVVAARDDLALRAADHPRGPGEPRADREVGVPGDQRRDQREQRVEVGREVDVHVGEHRRVRGRPHRAQGPAPALLVEVDHRDLVVLRRQGLRDGEGAVGRGVVGDGDAEAVGERLGEVRVETLYARARGRAPRCRRGRRRRAPGPGRRVRRRPGCRDGRRGAGHRPGRGCRRRALRSCHHRRSEEVDGRWVPPVIVLWVAGRRSAGDRIRRRRAAQGRGRHVSRVGRHDVRGLEASCARLCPVPGSSSPDVRFGTGVARPISGTLQTSCSPPTAGRRTIAVMTDQDPFARAAQPGEPAHSAGPAPRDGSAGAGVRYEPSRHDAPGYGAPGSDAGRTPANPWQAPTGGDTGAATMPRTEQPTGQTPVGHRPRLGPLVVLGPAARAAPGAALGHRRPGRWRRTPPSQPARPRLGGTGRAARRGRRRRGRRLRGGERRGFGREQLRARRGHRTRRPRPAHRRRPGRSRRSPRRCCRASCSCAARPVRGPASSSPPTG